MQGGWAARGEGREGSNVSPCLAARGASDNNKKKKNDIRLEK